MTITQGSLFFIEENKKEIKLLKSVVNAMISSSLMQSKDKSCSNSGGKDASWGKTHMGGYYCPGGLGVSWMSLLADCFPTWTCALSHFKTAALGYKLAM